VIKIHPQHQILWITLLFNLLLGSFFLYCQGINSPFIFDDIPNLSPLGQRQYLGFWHDVALFLLQGDSGPTGRPVSLLSFYLNDSTWKGATATSFKYTNVLLHLLNGVLVFWLALKLAGFTRATRNQCLAVALLTCGIWLLHPIQINSVLYVIQRMTELSSLFMLTGLLCYLHGRDHLHQTPWKGWLWLLLGGGISLLLSILSKETGILLIVYILAIEYALLRPLQSPPPRHLNIGLALARWLPFLLLLAYLLQTGLNGNNFAARPFDVTQRLLTEARVIWDYLSSILMPTPGKSTLFHDDFIISQHRLEPLTTLPAVLGIGLLLALVITIRKRQPVITFATAWFLGGHLLESTTVPLELYFEHRNYLPLFGIAFALAWYGITLQSRWRRAGQVVLATLLLTMVAVTQHGIVQWTHPVQMVAGWLQDHPRSQRTLEALDALIGEHISPTARQALLQELQLVSKQSQTSSYLIFRDLQLACRNRAMTPAKLETALTRLNTAGYTNSLSKAYADFITLWLNDRCGNLDAQTLLAFNEKLLSIPELQHNDMPAVLHYWQAEVQVKQGNLGATMQHLEASYHLQPTLDKLLIQATYLSSAGLYANALSKLQQAKQYLCKDWHSCMQLKLRQTEIDSLVVTLKQHLQKQQEASRHDNAVHHFARQE